MTRSNVITGASKIIGMAAAEALAAAGWKVIRVARHTPANFDSLMLVRHGPFMQTVDHAERFAREMPETRLVRIKSAAIFRWKTIPNAWPARWPASSGRSDDLGREDVMKVAILGDYQNVALKLADWSAVRRRAEISVFNDHVADTAAVVERLRPCGSAAVDSG